MLKRSASSPAVDASVVSLFKADDSSKAGVAAANLSGQAPFRRVLEASVSYFVAPDSASYAASREAASAAFPSPEAFTAASTLAERCIKSIIRLSLDSPSALSSLLAIGLQEPLAKDAAKAVNASGDSLRAALNATSPHLPSIDNLRWRVDVTISSSAAPKVLKPSVFAELTTTDGVIHSFEVPLPMLHSLRYRVAKMLNEMGVIEGHPVLKIN